MNIWIGLGSNMGDRAALIASALMKLDQFPGLHLLRHSSLYRTAPWGLGDQPEFLNAVAEFETDIDAPGVLKLLQQTENDLGRERKGQRWGPRKIDIDLLLFGEEIFILPGLVVPHPRMHRRLFVLEPLGELQAGLLIPGRGTVASCLARLYREAPDSARQGVEKSGPVVFTGKVEESLN